MYEEVNNILKGLIKARYSSLYPAFEDLIAKRVYKRVVN